MRLASFIALIAISITPFVSFAQSTVVEEGEEVAVLPLPASTPAGTVSCFDYYTFGSVQAKLTASVPSTVSGAPITFSGTLENANPYPVVDGALYVKVFKMRGTQNDGNGPDVVDQFFVQEDIAIPANGSFPISFEWRVPSYAQSGDYRVATFFTTSHKFNLLGLSFTDDIVGNTAPFTVIGEQEASVAFDKAGVTINGAAYRFATAPPRVGTAPATLEATVRNTSATSQRASVQWQVYQWDAQQAENIVQEAQSTVTVPANGSAPVSITVRDANHPVYLVVGTLSWKDTKSVIGARFARESINKPRINFPSITSFPLKAGESSSIFSCLHNTSGADLPQGRLDLTLMDKRGRTIAEYSYNGAVTSAMMGVASQFSPSRDYDYATLNARLYYGDSLVDEVTVAYDCAAIDPSQCLPQSYTWLYYVLAALALIIALYWFMHMRRAPEAPVAPQI